MGPARHLQLDLKGKIAAARLCRIGASETGLLLLSENGQLRCNLLKKTANLNSQHKSFEASAPPFDVESLAEVEIMSLEQQRKISKSFLPARAAARNVIL